MMFSVIIKSMIVSLFILSMMIFPATECCYSATLSVPDDFDTIQDAIDNAADGDTVLVAPGIYRENLKIQGQWINLVSTHGPENTILDGGKLDAVVTYYNTIGTPRLTGFTIVNGIRSGVSVSKSRPIIDDCIISNNGNWVGGGVYAHSGACPVVITNSEISWNSAQSQGGGAAANQACIQIRNSKILHNMAGRAGGAIVASGFCGGVAIEHSLVEGNAAAYFGGGFYSAGSNRCPPGVWSTNNLVINNEGRAGGAFYQGSYGRFEIRNDTVSQNMAAMGGGFMATPYSAYFRILNSIIFHNSTLPYFPDRTAFSQENIVAGSDIEGGVDQSIVGADTNISADPRFVDSANGDFSLQSGSPCIDSGLTSFTYGNNPEEELVRQSSVDFAGNLRLQGDGLDIGALEFFSVPVPVELKLAPKIVNLNSQGKWITAIITLPDTYQAAQVGLDSILLNGAIPVEKGLVEGQKIIAKFDRDLIAEYLESFEGAVDFHVRCEIPGAAILQGSDSIRVLPRKVR